MIGPFLLLSTASVPAGAQASNDPACERSVSNEITICGSRRGDSPYRMPKIAKDYKAKSIRAETQLAPGASANAHVEAEGMPDGRVSNRLMVTIKLKF